MPKAILWDAKPSAETLIAADGALKNLADDAIAVSAEVTNGTALKTRATFELYVHDFAAARMPADISSYTSAINSTRRTMRTGKTATWPIRTYRLQPLWASSQSSTATRTSACS